MNSRKFRQPAFSEVGYHPLRAGCSSVAVLWSPSSFLYQTLTIFTDYSQTPGVCCNYYVANRPLREGAGPLPALLLDLGASYLSSNYPLPFHGREEGDATKFDSMNLINTVRVKEINDERRTMRSNPGTPTLNTMERPLSTDTKSTTALHDPPVPVRAKLAAAWTSFMFFYIYVDYLHLYKPGAIDDILAGIVFEFDISQTFVVISLMLVGIPSLMILLSMTLPARANRTLNLVVASLYIPVSAFNVVGGAWVYFYGP